MHPYNLKKPNPTPNVVLCVSYFPLKKSCMCFLTGTVSYKRSVKPTY